MKTLYGAAVKRFFPGMHRTCMKGHIYVITETMNRNKSYKCPKCASTAAVEYAKTHREKKRAWNNAYHSQISNKRAASTAAYRANHPERKAAHQAIQTALRNGRLTRQPCGVCANHKSHAHHDDYAKPLDVLWLCHTHHMERHIMLAERAK